MVACFTQTARAQTDTNSILGSIGTQIGNFFHDGSNWVCGVYGIAVPKQHTGGEGIFAGYLVDPHVMTLMRVDCLNNFGDTTGGVWLPSLQVQLQMPIQINSYLRLTPLGYGGVAAPISGLGVANRQVVSIVGGGLALGIKQHAKLFVAWETWDTVQQIRFGGGWAF